MRNVDAEFDIPQFVASSLVRKIAENQFRLPEADRIKFAQLPDHVIARIEHIVRARHTSKLVKDVGGDILREHLWQQALVARRSMVENGELISEDAFRQRLGLTQRRLGKLLAEGSVFAIEVDDAEYWPSPLADPALDHKRLQAICGILFPAPAGSRHHFLTSQRGSLGGRRPLDMLDSDVDFKLLQRIAAVWAAEWSRAAVKLYRGEHEIEPKGVDPLYTAAVEIDPRKPLWERASEALHVHGYEWPLGPCPDVRKFSLFVEQQTAGDATPTPEACVQIVVDGDYIRVRIIAAPGTTLESETVPAGRHKCFIDIAKRVIAYLCKR